MEAAEKAISSPLLEDISIHGARGVLINITASPDVTLQEINEAAELIHGESDEEANIIWGMVIDPNLEDRVRVTVIATGFGASASNQKTVSMTSVRGVSGSAKNDKPTYVRNAGADSAASNGSGEVIKLKKLSVLSSAEDKEKYEIPTFLRKQMD